jgi:hypothetical protein
MTIWNLHKRSWRGYKSSAWYVDRLAREGFDVERGTAGMPTAFRARWSSGAGTKLAGYAENDAVPGQSRAPEPQRKPRGGKSFRAAGHTDPHSALGIGSLGGFLAAKHAMETHGLKGSSSISANRPRRCADRSLCTPLMAITMVSTPPSAFIRIRFRRSRTVASGIRPAPLLEQHLYVRGRASETRQSEAAGGALVLP